MGFIAQENYVTGSVQIWPRRKFSYFKVRKPQQSPYETRVVERLDPTPTPKTLISSSKFQFRFRWISLSLASDLYRKNHRALKAVHWTLLLDFLESILRSLSERIQGIRIFLSFPIHFFCDINWMKYLCQLV